MFWQRFIMLPSKSIQADDRCLIASMREGQSGYGNNTLVGNNGGGAQTLGGIILYRMQPNACNPACP